MSDNTKIEWADATVNAVNGCSVVSPGCTNCYAMRLAGTRMKHHPTREGLTLDSKAGPVWNGEVRLHEAALLQPLSWKRPRQIFWNAHGDLFHESVPDDWIDRIFRTAAMTPQHIHMILTKRSTRGRAYCSTRGRAEKVSFEGRAGWPLPNVWFGVSVEDQTRADERREDFRATPAAVKFVSYEPALGPIDWSGWQFVDQIIGGGESGPKARPSHPQWFRDTRDWCADNGVAYFHKQNGEWVSVYDRDRDDPEWTKVPKPGDWDRRRWLNLAGGQGFHGDKLNMMQKVGKKAAGRLLDGIEHNGLPG